MKQLKSLKSVTLSEDIKQSNRAVLLSQISNTFVKKESSFNYLNNLKNAFSFVYKPVISVAGIFVFLVGILFLSSNWLSKSKPNDSLYLARLMSERARLNTTFNENQRDALSLEFASNHAKDIATVLMDPEFNTENNKKEVERLNASFITEINKVENQINKTENNSLKSNNEDVVISASDLISGTSTDIFVPDEEIVEVDPDVLEEEFNVEALAEEINDQSDQLDEVKDGQKILAEIKTLFAESRYDEVVEKLNAVKDLIK